MGDFESVGKVSMTQRRNWVSNATCESSLDPASKRKGSTAAFGGHSQA